MASRPGILLLHGFCGRPADMEFLRRRFEREGWDAATPRLAGHDSVIEALEASRWIDWERAAVNAWRRLAGAGGFKACLGLSAGGSLALRLAALQKRPPDAVVTVNTAVDSPDWRLPLAGCLRHVRRGIASTGRDIEDPTVRGANPGLPFMPVRAAWQFYRLLEETRPLLGRVRSPTLALRSRVDHTVDPRQADRLARALGTGRVQVAEMERGWHVATLDAGKEKLWKLASGFLRKERGSGAR